MTLLLASRRAIYEITVPGESEIGLERVAGVRRQVACRCMYLLKYLTGLGLHQADIS